jgi:Pathogenicity locus
MSSQSVAARAPQRKSPKHLPQLEDLPNIGKAIAADLRRIGINQPEQLAQREPLDTYCELSTVMGRRHDPCVLYTLIAVQHFFQSGEARPWWTFTAAGKSLLQAIKSGNRS